MPEFCGEGLARLLRVRKTNSLGRPVGFECGAVFDWMGNQVDG